MTFNTLFVNRLIIFSSTGLIAYDENFHHGVNIIRGENSSGKSTITNFVFFVLGGDFIDFVPEAKKCRDVYAETYMNGEIVTIRRSIELDENNRVRSRTPMYFYWGDYEESKNPSPEKSWLKFGYNSYPEIKSYSNVIFDNLDIPIVKGDNNITVHQLLRLMYIDQESPTSSLFLYEQFDSQITRETVAELLLGLYEEDLYQNKRRLLELIKEIDEIKAEIKATKGFFTDDLALLPSHIETRIDSNQKKIAEIEEQVISIKNEESKSKYKLDQFKFKSIADRITQQRVEVANLNEEIHYLNNEVADNELFISALREKLQALKNSLKTREFLNNFPISYCPECLTEIKNINLSKAENKCKLCKESIDSSFGLTQGRRMEQEINFQIIESESIQKDVKERLERLKPNLQKQSGILRDLQKRLDAEFKDIRTSNQEQIENLYVEKGFLEGEILQFRSMLENAMYYQELVSKKDKLGKERDLIEFLIKKGEGDKTIQYLSIDNQIKKEALYLLQHDLHRQDEFKNANDFHIDFSNNMAFLVNKFARYSASSNFYLKVTARFALFLASLTTPIMRYPRFILADNMEDKGIEEKRAQNLQKILIERLTNFDPLSFQVIYTTSYITEALNNSPYVVGEFYTKDNRTLKNVS